MKLKKVPNTTNIDLEPIQARIKIPKTMIGQGVFIKNFSNQTKNINNGSKKFSIASPYVREKSVNAKSTDFLNSLKSDLLMSGKLKNQSILYSF